MSTVPPAPPFSPVPAVITCPSLLPSASHCHPPPPFSPDDPTSPGAEHCLPLPLSAKEPRPPLPFPAKEPLSPLPLHVTIAAHSCFSWWWWSLCTPSCQSLASRPSLSLSLRSCWRKDDDIHLGRVCQFVLGGYTLPAPRRYICFFSFTHSRPFEPNTC
jgi:hypothetical protein